MATGYRGSRRRRSQRQAEERRKTLSTATRVGRYNIECKRQWQSLKAKVAGALMAMALYAAPVQEAEAAEASGIQRTGESAPLTPENNVYTILAETNNGSIATNRFASFDLPSQQIANMYFHKEGQTSANDAAALVNFVLSDIKINGTVNALRNNAIGGKLYFVTPKSIVVSSTGVINAGAITLQSGAPFPQSDVAGAAEKVTKGTYLSNKGIGSITVAGQLNAPDFISLVSSKTILLQTGAKLQTSLQGKNGAGAANNTFDFAELVNIRNADGSIKVNSGLTENLQLSRSSGSDGNIMLAVVAKTKNHKSEATQKWLTEAGNNTIRAEITAESGTVINADGVASFGASATRDNTDMGSYITFGDAMGLEADVALNGSVTGKQVDVSATTSGTYKKGIWEAVAGTVKGAVKNELFGLLGEVGDLDLVFLGSRASSKVSYGAEASITATGADSIEDSKITKAALNTEASSTIELVTTANASNAGTETGQNLAGLALLYTYADNTATIETKAGAQLNASAGSIANKAAAKTSIETTSASKGNKDAKGADKFAAAINITLGQTRSLIDLQAGSTLTAYDNLTAQATSSQDTVTTAAIQANDSTYVSTAVQALDMDSSSIINANGVLTATGGRLALTAEDASSIDAYASNAVKVSQGEDSWLDWTSSCVAKGVQKGIVEKVVNGLKGKASQAAPEQDDIPDGQQNSISEDMKIGDTAFSLGASINIALGEHQGTVNIGEKAKLTSGGAMDITAKQTFEDFNLVTTGASSASNSTATINAAVGISRLTDSSAINIAGGTTAADGHPVLTAGGALTLDAASTYKWDRINAMVDYLKSKAKVFGDDFKTVFYSTFKDEIELANINPADYEANPTASMKIVLAKAAGKNNFGTKLNTWLKSLLKVPGDGIKVARAAQDFLNAASYVNINVGSVSQQSGQGGDGQASVNSAAAIAVNSLSTTSTITVGKNAQLQATGDLTATAKADQTDVNYYGALQGLAEALGANGRLGSTVQNALEKLELDLNVLPAWSSGTNAVGGNLSWNTNKLSSAVVVAEGASLRGKDVTLQSDTDRRTGAVTLGGGKGSSAGVTGMFAITRGSSNSLVSVDDEAKVTATGSNGLQLKADNDSLVVDIVGDLTVSESKAVGVSLGYVTNNANTFAAVADNDKDGDHTEANKTLNQLLQKLLTEKQQQGLGSKAADLSASALLQAPELGFKATSTPQTYNFAVAGAVVKSSGGLVGAGELVELDDLEADGPNDEMLSQAGASNGRVESTKVLGSGALTIQNMHGTTGALLEGSQRVGTTGSNTQGLTVQLTDGGASRAVSLEAVEDGVAVAPAGALSLKTSGVKGNSGSIAGVAAVNDITNDVYSQIKNATITDAAAVKNTASQEETLVAVAVPLNIDLSKEDQKGFSGALNASVNLVDNKIHADMVNNTVQQTSTYAESATADTLVQNAAYDSSVQVTGGLNLDVAKSTLGLGVNVAYAKLNNDVQATVAQGSYTNIGAFSNEAVSDLYQLTLGVGVGVGAGDSSVAALGAVGASSHINNTLLASLDGASISGVTLENRAYDGEKGKSSDATVARRRSLLTYTFTNADGTTTEKALVDMDAQEVEKLLKEQELEQEVDTTKLDSNVDKSLQYDPKNNKAVASTKEEENTYTTKKLTFEDGHRNRIYTGALELEGAFGDKSKFTLGVGVANASVDNAYTASIKDSTITLAGSGTGEEAKGLTVQAASDTYIAGFAVGVAVTTGGESLFNGAGSVTVAHLENDTIATVTDSTIKSNVTSISASTTGQNVSVAGDIGYGDGKLGLGLAVAVNTMDNTTQAGLYGGSLSGYNSGAAALKLAADNSSDQLALGIGLSFSGTKTGLLAQGNVAVNSGKNDTVAEVAKGSSTDEEKAKAKLTKMSSVQITAKDTATQKAAAAGLVGSGANVGVGIGFAVNQITNQTLAARLNNATVTTTGSGDIDVTTDETMKLTTVGVGVAAGQSKGGSADITGAITLAKNKQNTAEMVGTSLTYDSEVKAEDKKSDVLVKARENNKIVSNADAITANITGGSGLTSGLAGSGLTLDSHTTAQVKDSTIHAQDVEVNADSVNNVYNVALGIGGSGSYVGVAGSLGLNTFTGGTAASIAGSTVLATNSVGVLADSSCRLVNVTGGLTIGTKSALGVGLAVAVNKFDENTSATVSGSTIEAQGLGTKELTAHRYTTGDNNELTTTASAKRKDKSSTTDTNTQHKGLVVDAYSTHDLTDVVVTGGITVDPGEIGAAVTLTGAGSRDNLGGSTKALVEKSDINKGLDDAHSGDVVVTAFEDTDVDTVDVNLGVAASGNIAVTVEGTMSFSNLNRTVEAKIAGEEQTDVTKRRTVNADKMVVAAGAMADRSSVLVGVNVAGSGTGAGGGNALVNSVTSTYTVNAEVSNVNGRNNGLELQAAHDGRLSATGVGVNINGSGTASVSLGATVGLMTDKNTVTGTLKNAVLAHGTKGTAAKPVKDSLAVTNYHKATPDLVSVNIAGASMVAVDVGVNYDEHEMADRLKLNVENAQLGLENGATTTDLKVNNYYDLEKTSVGVNLAGAYFSGAVGVTVQPVTLNSSNILNVTGSKIYGDAITLQEEETRRANVNSVEANVGLMGSVGVTRTYLHLGGALQEKYSTQQGSELSEDNLAKLMSSLNTTLEKDKQSLDKGIGGAVKAMNDRQGQAGSSGQLSAGISATPQATTGTATAEGQLLRVSNSALTGTEVALSSKIKDDIDVYSATGGAGAGTVNVDAARVDETIKNKLELVGSTLRAGKLAVLANVTGKSYAHTAIGSFSGLGINIGYADVYADGSNAITIDGSSLQTADSLLVRALHDSTYQTYTNGGAYSSVGGSYTEAESTDSIGNTVTVKNNSQLLNTGKQTGVVNTTDTTQSWGVTGAMELASVKASTAKTETKYGAVGNLQIGTNSSTAKVEGKAAITMENSTAQGTGAANQLDLYALYNSVADVKMTYGSGGIGAGTGGVAGHAASGTVDSKGNATSGAVITLSNNTLDLTDLSAHTVVGANNELAKLHTETYNISVALSVGVNKTDATMATESLVTFKNNTIKTSETRKKTGYEYRQVTADGRIYTGVSAPLPLAEGATEEEKAAYDAAKVAYEEAWKDSANWKQATGDEKGNVWEQVEVYKTEKTAKTNLSLQAETKGDVNSKVTGVDAALGVSVGHNRAKTTTAETTMVSMTGTSQETMLKSLTLNASGVNKVANRVDGHNGSILNVSPVAAEVDNTSTINTSVDMKGKFTVSGTAQLNAGQGDNFDLHADTASGGAVNVTGATITNTRTGATTISLSGAALQAETVSLLAHNDMRMNNRDAIDQEGMRKNEKFTALQGDSGSAIDVTTFKVTNSLTESAAVTLKDKSSLLTTGSLKVAADTINNVFVTAKGDDGGALAETQITVDNTLTYDDTITVEAGSSLATTSATGDISLSAVDDSNLQAGAYANSYFGAITIPEATTNNTTTRKNIININGTLDSRRDIKLYAGQYDSLAMAGLHAVIDTQTYSGSLVIPAKSRTLTNTIEEYNVVKVAQGAVVRSVVNTDIYANEGVVTIHKNNFGASVWSSDDPTKDGCSYVTMSSQPGSAGDVDLKQHNYVEINGTVEAGRSNKLAVVIGEKNQVVLLEPEQLAAYNASNEAQAVALPVISINGKTAYSDMTAEEKQVYDGISFGSMDILNSLLENYRHQKQLLQEYSTSSDGTVKGDASAYQAIVASLAQTEAKLEQLGMVAIDEKGAALKDKDGNLVVLSSLKTDYVSLPDIAVSGGNLTIETMQLNSSSGSISAKGNPNASITNGTNLYTLLGSFQVGDAGGRIVLNNKALNGSSSTAQLNQDINNALQGSTASFASILAESSSAAGTLSIANTYDNPVTYSATAEGTAVYSRFVPDMELAAGKSITSEYGKVTLSNIKGNIVINGTLNAKNLEVTSREGGIYQDSPESLVNIGGEIMKKDGGYDTPAAEAGRIAGGNIYLNAQAINMNGLVQSGYDEYTVDTSQYKDKLTQLDQAYAAGRLAKLSDDQVRSQGEDSAFCLSKGKSVYNASKGYYDYQPAVYYNPATQTVLVDEIVSSGGNIYLSGNLASTGNGRIYAMDGSADVTVRNPSFTVGSTLQVKDLKLYGITTSNVQGKITLVDTKRNAKTVITKGGYTITDILGAPLKDSTGNVLSAGELKKIYDGTNYTPVAGQVYTWTTGSDYVTRTRYQRKFEENWWGLRKSKDVTQELDQATKVNTKILNDDEKGNLTAIIDAPSAIDTSKVYNTQSVTTNVTSKASEPTVTRWSTGLFGYRKHELYEWYVDTGGTRTTSHYVKADQPVKVGFMGDGTGSISVTSDGSINLSGSIGSRSLNSAVNITSVRGSLVQEKGTLQANEVALSTAGHMQGITIAGGSNVALRAVNTATTKVVAMDGTVLTVDTVYYNQGKGTTINDGNAMDITVNTQTAEGTAGTVNLQGLLGNKDSALVSGLTLTTNGNIIQSDFGAGAENAGLLGAAKITLTAADGAIGTAGSPVKVNTPWQPTRSSDPLSASVNAHAAGDIYLHETNEYLRVGTIISDNGDVTLSGAGSLVDALPYESIVRSGLSDDELVAQWTEMGLLGEHISYKRDDNGQLLTTTEANGHPVYELVDENDPGKGYKTTPVYGTEPMYNLAGEEVGTRQVQIGTTRVQKKDAAGKGLYYVLQKQTWEADKLLYAISDQLINPHSGLEPSTKEANISARNITLNMADSAGLNSETVTSYKISTLGSVVAADAAAGTAADTTGLDALKLLARADASSVTWDSANDMVTVNQKLPVGVDLKGDGRLTVIAGTGAIGTPEGHVYMENRSATGKELQDDLYVENITAKGNILLNNAYGGIYQAATATGAAISSSLGGLDINVGMVNGPARNIGLENNSLLISIAGPLRTTSTGNVYLKQVDKDLYVQSGSVGGDLNLVAEKNILGYMLEGAPTGYLRLEGDGTMLVQSLGGNVGRTGGLTLADGDKVQALRLLNQEDPADDAEAAEAAKIIRVKAAGDIYLHGATLSKNSAIPLGTMYLDGLQAGDSNSINLDVNGNIYLSDKIDANAINAKAALRVSQSVTTDSEGSITGGSTLKARSLSVTSGTGFKLDSSNNELKDIYLTNTGPDDEDLVNSLQGKGYEKEDGTKESWSLKKVSGTGVGSRADNISEVDMLVGSLTLTNLDTDIMVTENGQVKTTGNYQATAVQGSIHNQGSIFALGDLKLSAQQDIVNDKELASLAGDVNLTAGGDIWNRKTIMSMLGDVNLESTSLAADTLTGETVTELHGIINGKEKTYGDPGVEDEQNKIYAYGSINAKSATNIVNKYQWLSGYSVLTAETAGITAEARGRLVNYGSMALEGQGDLKLSGGTVMYNDGQIILNDGGNVILESPYGLVGNMQYDPNGSSTDTSLPSVVIRSKDPAKEAEGSITVTAQDIVVNSGALSIQGKGDILLSSIANSVYNREGAAITTRNGNITLEALTKDAALTVFDYYMVPIANPDKTKLHYNGTSFTYDGKEAAVSDVGSVYNTGDVVANQGTAALLSVSGNVFNYDDLDYFESASYNNQAYDGRRDVATNSIIMSAAQGYLYNDHNVISDGDVLLEANTGLDSFAHNIYAQKDITLIATGGSLRNTTVLESVAGNVTLTAQEGSIFNTGDIVALDGDVTLQAESTGTAQSLTVTMDGSSKEVNYDGGSVVNSGDIIAYGTTALDPETGKYVSAKGTITLSSKAGGVYNYDDFNTYQGTYGKVDGQAGKYYYTAEKRAGITSGMGVDKSYDLATNDIIMSAPDGELYTEKDYLIAGGKVDLTARTGLQSFGKTIYAGSDITLRATEGNIYNNAELVSTQGNITLQSDRGAVVNMLDGDLMAFDGTVSLKAGAVLSEAEAAAVYENSQLCFVSYDRSAGSKTALEGTITDNTGLLTNSILLVDKYYKDGDTYRLIDQDTDVTALAGKDIYTVFTAQGQPDKTKSPLVAPAKTPLSVGTAGSGANLELTNISEADIATITVNGQEIKAVQANLEGYRSNDALNRGDALAMGGAGVILTSEGGNAVNYDNFNYMDGQNTIAYKGENLKVGTSTGLITDAMPQLLPDPLVGKKILLSTDGIDLEGPEGYIYNSFEIATEGDMIMISGWDLTAGTNYAASVVGGDLALVSIKGEVVDDSQLVNNAVGGNISMEGRKGVDARTALTSESGSVWLTSLEGNVKTQDISAVNGMVVVGSRDGNLELGKTITGQDVVLYTSQGNIGFSGGAEAKITANGQLVVSGKEVDMPTLSGQGSLAVNAEHYQATHTQDTIYTGLSVKDAVVQVEGGTLSIDRLTVTGNASFRAEDFDASVFGKDGTYAPGYHVTYYDVGGGTAGTDGANRYRLNEAIGFNNLTSVSEVKARVKNMADIISQVKTTVTQNQTSPASWNGKDNDGWMNLYIDDDYHQRSTGLLLDLDPYYYTGPQRLSLRDLCGKEDDFKPQAVFFVMLQPVLSQPRNLQGVTIPSQIYGEIVAVEVGVRNATADELVVSEE